MSLKDRIIDRITAETEGDSDPDGPLSTRGEWTAFVGGFVLGFGGQYPQVRATVGAGAVEAVGAAAVIGQLAGAVGLTVGALGATARRNVLHFSAGVAAGFIAGAVLRPVVA